MKRCFLTVAIIFALGLVGSCEFFEWLYPLEVEYERDKLLDNASNLEKMQAFIMDISTYARNENPDFIVIPQNGTGLIYTDSSSRNRTIRADFIEKIDGFGIEELFYSDNGTKRTDSGTLTNMRALKANYPNQQVMVADYVKDNDAGDISINLNSEEGFISFPRINNYDYNKIPDHPNPITGENANNINKLIDAKNYLYYIGASQGRSSIISAINGTNYDVVFIDLYANGTFTRNEIQSLKTKKNGGRRLVISYISIGSAENYRYYWKTGWGLNNPSWLKQTYSGYPNEFWVEFHNREWQDIIFDNDDSYIKRILNAGFDGVYLDNVEVYTKNF